MGIAVASNADQSMFSAQQVSGCSHFSGIGISNRQMIGSHQFSDLYGIDANKMNFDPANVVMEIKDSVDLILLRRLLFLPIPIYYKSLIIISNIWYCYGWAFRDILKFGNKMTVQAVGNPTQTGKGPAILYDRASGYGIVRFNRNTRDITIVCWSRWSDPSKPDAKQYPGWPVKINQLDNYGRKAYGYLPKIQVTGMIDPVVQVIDQENSEVVYTLRISGTSFQPWVFKDGIYRVHVGEFGTDRVKVLRDLMPGKMADWDGIIEIEF